jgi:hypothetical protein
MATGRGGGEVVIVGSGLARIITYSPETLSSQAPFNLPWLDPSPRLRC